MKHLITILAALTLTARGAPRPPCSRANGDWLEQRKAIESRLREVVAPPVPEPTARQLRNALENLHALVWGECPSLLNEDSGGNSALDMEILDLLAPPKATPKQPIAVPSSTDADTANRQHGDAYGVDWVYEATHTQPASEPEFWAPPKRDGEWTWSDSETVYKTPKAGWRPLYATPQPAAKPAQAGNDEICGYCAGAGSVTAMTSHLGPDDYEVEVSCKACNGTGALLDEEDLATLAQIDQDFEDAEETSVAYEVLMRFARMGYLECTHFAVTSTGRAAINAATKEQL